MPPQLSYTQRPSFRSFATEKPNNEYDWDNILPLESGPHNSAKVLIPSKESNSLFHRSNFSQKITATIEACRELKKSSIWVEVPMCQAGLIEEMVETGLQFHHAKGNSASLYLWLDKTKENKVPEYATHHVGVGAMVVNSKDEILCVRELGKNYNRWKIPGGRTEVGEQLDEGAVREVLEETGIRCRFISVLCVRHSHGIQFGRSDLYFVCRLEAIEGVDDEGNEVIPAPVAQVNEIEVASWLPMEEYKAMVNAPDGHPMMKHVVELYEQNWSLYKTIVPSVVPGRKASPIYRPHSRNPDSNK